MSKNPINEGYVRKGGLDGNNNSVKPDIKPAAQPNCQVSMGNIDEKQMKKLRTEIYKILSYYVPLEMIMSEEALIKFKKEKDND